MKHALIILTMMYSTIVSAQKWGVENLIQDFQNQNAKIIIKNNDNKSFVETKVEGLYNVNNHLFLTVYWYINTNTKQEISLFFRKKQKDELYKDLELNSLMVVGYSYSQYVDDEQNKETVGRNNNDPIIILFQHKDLFQKIIQEIEKIRGEEIQKIE